jgi:hypothetical protein
MCLRVTCILTAYVHITYMHSKYILHGVHKYSVHAYLNMSKACIWCTYIRRTKKHACKFKENLKNNWKPFVRRPCGWRECHCPSCCKVGCHCRVIYYGRLNSMLFQIWKNCILFNLSSHEMVHNFKWYPMVFITKYNWMSSSNLNLSCSLLTVQSCFFSVTILYF